jgi:hypothetical protein
MVGMLERQTRTGDSGPNDRNQWPSRGPFLKAGAGDEEVEDEGRWVKEKNEMKIKEM